MSTSALPPEVLSLIEARDVTWSIHAGYDSVRLGLEWEDVIQVARTAESWKRTNDDKQQAVDGYVDAVVGRDRHGRRLYLAGKQVYFDEERCWHVLTFHEAR